MTTIELLRAIRPELRWTPVQGEHTVEFIERKRKEIGGGDPNAFDSVLFEAQTILGRCVPPSEKSGADTGLIVGYVQSGKTLSFTTVMSLARDNGYQLVILLAGIAVNLKNQSERRLGKDLGLDDSGRSWRHFENPSKEETTAIQNALDMWASPKVPLHKRRSVLVTVLKNHTRLKNLVAVLRQLKLRGVPALIIDDEGDQASLNTKAARNRLLGTNDTSTTYDWITQLKSAVPHHTFLQYTATPQANLLIGIADVLSPSFAELVTPGSGYVGGKEFFGNGSQAARVIPANEIPSATNPIRVAPPSLHSALRFFLLGAAAHTSLGQSGNRSMMVHPSQKTAPHADYKQWVEDTVKIWRQHFELPSNDPAYQACIDLFRPEYANLQMTFDGLPAFDQLMEMMPSVLLETRIVQVNSTQQGLRDVQWAKSDYWILVGGQKLDRGFTVEGLTVTYMPRSLGAGNADTLQQRARFLGYKKSYEGLCRVFLAQDVKDAFVEYVEHEEFVRDALMKFRGCPLMEWKRDFILTHALNPTRASVIGLDINSVVLDEGWTTPYAMYRDSRAVEHNRRLFQELVARWKNQFGCVDAASTYEEFKDRRPKAPRNMLIEGVPLREVLEKFMLRVRVPDMRDSQSHAALALALSEALQRSTTGVCDVFLIADLRTDNQHRSVLKNGSINQVFQGESPAGAKTFDALNYVGDRALRSSARPTLHLRVFELNLPAGMPGESKEVPWYALYLPAEYTKDLIIEREGRPHVRKR